MTHTPAPWKIHDCGKHRNNPRLDDLAIVYGENEEHICDTVYEIADANLIIAAPDLLEALCDMVSDINETSEATLEFAKKAINKAKGLTK